VLRRQLASAWFELAPPGVRRAPDCSWLIELERKVPEGMGSRVEQFEQIRRDRDRGGLSLRALAVRHGVHRRTVKQALASPMPPAKRTPVGRPAPKLGPYRSVIDGWLEADRGRAAQAAAYREADPPAPR
jgi:hypothetical protein